MKIKDLAPLIFDTVAIYEAQTGADADFLDIYKGKPDGIPEEIAEMEISNIGAARRGILDIEVRRV